MLGTPVSAGFFGRSWLVQKDMEPERRRRRSEIWTVFSPVARVLPERGLMSNSLLFKDLLMSVLCRCWL